MLLRRIYPVRVGDALLVQAAAGGLGQILTRWAKQLGASVIATVGSEAKVAIAREAGADHVLLHRDADLAEQVRALTGGKGVHVAYDGIGGDMLRRTLACVRPFGMRQAWDRQAALSRRSTWPNSARFAPSHSAAQASSPTQTSRTPTGPQQRSCSQHWEPGCTSRSGLSTHWPKRRRRTPTWRLGAPRAASSSSHEARYVCHTADLPSAGRGS